MTSPSHGEAPFGLRDRRITRPDGRDVAFCEWGEPDGRPVLRVPGTPSSRFGVRADMTPWAERGLRIITTERPGFGASTRLPGRGFLEHADDLAAILDELGLDRVPVIGGSGASPHILALCARHPERVIAATISVGGAPLEEDEVGEMIGINQTCHHLALAGDVDGLRAVLAPARESVLADPLAGFRAMMDTAPPPDQEIMDDPQWQEAFVVSIREAFRPGVDGWCDEALALTASWDEIEPERVACSVTWWHGTDDHNAPLSAARRLVDRLPDAELRVWEDAGHFTPYRNEPEILDELLARC